MNMQMFDLEWKFGEKPKTCPYYEVYNFTYGH